MSPLLPANKASQTEECQTIPTRTGDRNCDRTQGGVVPVLILESHCQHLHQNGASFPFPAEQRTREWQTAIPIPAIQISWHRPDRLAFDRQEVSRRDLSQVSILRDLVRSPTSPLG
jgi:hypothetical protein